MDGSDGSVLKDQNDLLALNINLNETSAVSGLQGAETVKLIVQAPAGGQTYTELKTPRSIEDNSSYIL
jgi:hypothetical protein